MIKAEHWTDEDGTEHTLAEPASLTRQIAAGGKARLCCTIEGESWEDCLRRYHEHMGWEPWEPPGREG